MTTPNDNCNPVSNVSNVSAIGSTEKMSLTSSTLKRNPKMELSRSDLLRLLSILEGELQAREIVIAVLKAEQIKKLLYPNKSSPKTTFSSKTVKPNTNANNTNDTNLVQYSDPWNALSRDAFGAYDPSFDKTTTIALFNIKMTQLEALILQQRRARHVLNEQLRSTETKYNRIVAELEEERRLKHEADGQTSGQSDGPVDCVNRKLENDIKILAQSLEKERNREKQIVLCLLSERKQLIIKLIEERQRNEELLHLLSSEKAKISEMVEGLEDESKRSLQMEAELEKYLSDFEGEREKFRNQLSASETRNAELAAEVDRLRQELSGKALNSVSLGEGVRSAIVTMSSSTRCVPTVPSVSTVSLPRAQHVSPKPLTNASSAQTQSTAKATTGARSAVSAQHSYATVQPISSAKMNATIPPPPSVPAPPPKALISSSTSSSTKPTANPNPHSSPQTAKVNANAFQNMTYSLEPIASNSGNTSATSPTPTSTTTQSNHSTNTVNQTANTTPATKVMVQMSQTATTQSTQVQSATQPNHPSASQPTQPIQRKLSASGAGRGTPPPIPPNKPIIKPVLPPQALQQRSKELNSTKVSAGSVGTAAKIVTAINSTTSPNTTNNVKNTTINASDSTGEQNSCQQTNSISSQSNSTGSNSANVNTDTNNVNNVDLLCQELENFNSLLVSMVSTGSQKSS